MVQNIPRDLSIFTSLECCAIVVKEHLRNWCICVDLRVRRHRGGGIGGRGGSRAVFFFLLTSAGHVRVEVRLLP
eukprot:1806840-Pyramimonas_sp.AAC.1